MIKLISTQVLVFLFFTIAIVKTLLFSILSQSGSLTFGGGNDAEYYHAYAIGELDVEANIWPVLLRILNEVDMYSRECVSWFLVFLSCFAIPLISALIIDKKIPSLSQKYFWITAILVGCYATLFFFSMDIYRDVFMVFVFLVGVFYIRNYIYSSNAFLNVLRFTLILLIGWFLYLLRPYLGASLIMAFLFFNVFKIKKFSMIINLSLFFLLINSSYFLGLFDPIINYRESFLDTEAGSNLNIQFDSPYTFVPNFIKSFLFQVAGMYVVNLSSIIVFFIESAPILGMFFYLIKNKYYFDKFCNFLLIFFIVYSTIWVIGNDNLGTAVRLRIYNYLAVILCFMIVLQNKIYQLKRLG